MKIRELEIDGIVEYCNYLDKDRYNKSLYNFVIISKKAIKPLLKKPKDMGQETIWLSYKSGGYRGLRFYGYTLKYLDRNYKDIKYIVVEYLYNETNFLGKCKYNHFNTKREAEKYIKKMIFLREL